MSDFLISKHPYHIFFNASSFKGYSFKQQSLGDLNLPTGVIVASDPIVTLGRSLPFNKTVNPGIYPVTAAVCIHPENGNRIALVKIDFLSKPITKWEMALTEYDDVSLITREDDFFGFPVDTGLASFCDAATQESFEAFSENFNSNIEDLDLFQNQMDALLEKNENPLVEGYNWTNYTIPNTDQQNIIMFTSGNGDGNYPCYWGLTEDNEIAAIIVDFFIIQDL